MKQSILPKAFVLIAIILFSVYVSSASLIDGGGFEGTEVNDNWFNAVCGKTASPPISGSINRAGAGGWIADTNLSTEGSLAGFCRFGFATGSSGSGKSPRVCIIKSDATNKDCTIFTNDAEPLPAEQFIDVEIDLTQNYGSDFNILMFWFSTIDRNFFSIAYNGSTELVSGDKLLIDIELCKSGGNQCNTGELIGSINGYIGIDNIRTTGQTLVVTEPVEPIPSFTSFEIRATLQDLNGDFIQTADVNITLDGDTNAMAFSSGFYRITFPNGLAEGNFPFSVDSSFESVDKTFNGTLEVETQEFQYLTITPIENIESFSFNSVDFIPSDDDDQIIWQVDSNSATSETPEFKIVNENVDGKQYFIFTGPDVDNLAFDDTLTFGSDETNPIQKIWNQDTELYTHSFFDTLSAGETKVYKLTYKSPFKHFFSIKDSPEWAFVGGVIPGIFDVNTFDVDEYSISNVSNIRSLFEEQVPDVFQDETVAFELQFTAHSDVNGTQISAGQTVLGADSVNTVTLTSTPHRFSFTIDATDFESQAIITTNNSTSAQVFITDYAIVARGFFTKRLELFKANQQPLDVFLLNGFSTRFLQEGLKFRIDTEAYDREGVLRTFIIESFLDGTSDNNKVKQVTTVLNFDESDNEFEDPEDVDETTLTFFQVLQEGIIDIEGNAFDPDPPRTVTVRAKLTDNAGKTVAIQSQTVTFLQYPFFPDDLIMNFFATEKRKGKHPKGLLELRLKDPAVLEGLDFRIYSDANTISAPNFREIIYKSADFDCVSTNCSLEINFPDFIFEDVNLTTITVLALLNTETLDLSNRLTRTDTRIFVTPIEFKVGKIHQVVERIDDTYRADEEISLVLILRDSEATNVRNQIDTFITLENCDQAAPGGNCVTQTTVFKPTGFIYDDEFNLNYYFFRHLFILDDGTLLPDGNFIGFHATIDDKTGIRTEITPVLASKCLNNTFLAGIAAKGVPFLSSLLGEGVKEAAAGLVCTDAPQADIVSTTANNAQEERLEIDVDHATSTPSQEAIVCLAPNTNNVISKPLEADLFCYVAYTIGEKPIDDFRFRITNQFSDVTNVSGTKQYLEFNIPYPVIAFNDIFTLREQLKLFSDTSINTLGEFIFHGFRSLVKTQFDLYNLNDLTEFQTKTGIIQNIGGDINFNQAFDPTVTTTGYFFIVKGIPVENIHKFALDTRFGDDFEFIDRKNFFNFMAENNIPIPENSTTLEVFSTSFVVPFEFKTDGTLIIEEEAPEQKLNQRNLDSNTTQNFPQIPTLLTFNMQNTMFFNNFSQNDTLSFVLNILVIIKKGALEGLLGFFNEFAEDPVDATTGLLANLGLLIAIILIILIIVSIIYNNFKERDSGGGTTIIDMNRRS